MLTEILTFLSAFQYPYSDRCPWQIYPQGGVQAEQFAGRWYEHSRYPNFLQDSNRCTSVDVEGSPEAYFAYRVNVTNLDAFGNKDVKKGIYSDRFDTILNALQADSLTNHIWRGIFSFNNFKVISTDYTSYAIVYNCYELNASVWPFFDVSLFHSRLVWIFTRERVPSDETLQVAHNILTENGLSLDPLIETDQSDCDEVNNL